MGKKLKKLFCITFVVIFVSSTFLMSGCLRYVVKTSSEPCFVFLNKQATNKFSATITQVQYYFEAIARKILDGLVDAYGPEASSGNTNYYIDPQFGVEFNLTFPQLLSVMDRIATYNYSGMYQITAFSNCDVVMSESGVKIAGYTDQIFSYDQDNFCLNLSTQTVKGVSPFIKISNGFKVYANDFDNDQIDLTNGNFSNGVYYFYQNHENENNEFNWILFYIQQRASYDTNLLGRWLSGNINVAYKDNQPVPIAVTSTSVELTEENGCIKRWRYPLSAKNLNNTIYSYDISLYAGDEKLKESPLVSAEKAKAAYHSDFDFYVFEDKYGNVIKTDDLVARIAAKLVKNFMFGYSENDSANIEGVGLSYDGEWYNYDVNTDLKEANVTLKQLYEAVMSKTEDGARICANSYKGAYDVFSRCALAFCEREIETTNFTGENQNKLSADMLVDFDKVILKDIIGVEDNMTYRRDYATTVANIVANACVSQEGEARKVAEEYTKLVGETNEYITDNHLNLYEVGLSDLYGKDLQEKDDVFWSNAGFNSNVQSIIIPAKLNPKGELEWEDDVNPFEGDKASEDEFVKEFEESESAQAGDKFVISSISITLYANGLQYQSDSGMENIIKQLDIHILLFSALSGFWRVSEYLPGKTLKTEDYGRITLTYSNFSEISVQAYSNPFLNDADNRAAAEIYNLEDETGFLYEKEYGYGYYFQCIPNVGDSFAQIVFARPNVFANIDLSIYGIKIN